MSLLPVVLPPTRERDMKPLSRHGHLAGRVLHGQREAACPGCEGTLTPAAAGLMRRSGVFRSSPRGFRVRCVSDELGDTASGSRGSRPNR